MERSPRDSRLRYTKECLYRAFLEFLEEKPVSEITVSEICERAGVSRKTFYRYYPDQFGLLMGMQDDLFADYRDELSGKPADVRQITPLLIRFADQNRTLVKAVFENRGKGNFLDRIIDDMWETYRLDWEQANPQLAPAEVESLFFYVVSGMVGLVRHWLFDRPEITAGAMVEQAQKLLEVSDPKR